jgi:hypothetical protein
MANPTGVGGFRPGEVGNPNGRPLGSRNKRTKEIINEIIKSGNKDPLITLVRLPPLTQALLARNVTS